MFQSQFRSILRFEFDLWRRIRRIQRGRVAKCRSSTTEGTKDTENSKNKPLVQTKNDWRWKGKKTIESATNEKFMNGECDS